MSEHPSHRQSRKTRRARSRTARSRRHRVRWALAALVASTLLGSTRLEARPRMPPAEPPPVRFEHLSNRDGLSQMTVYDILQDRLGFLWIGTADGLNRYDGERFEIFKHQPGNPESLSSGAITALLEDRHGALWIGTHNGLNRYDPRRGEIVRFRLDPRSQVGDDPANNEIWALLEDPGGDLWIGTWGGGLHRFDPDGERFESFRHDPDDPKSLPGSFVPALAFDSDGDLWVGTWDGGLGRYDRASGHFESFHYDPAAPRGLDHDSIRALHFDRQDQLWIGTLGGGLLRFDRQSGRFESFSHDPDDPCSLGDDYVFNVLEDQNGDLWIATLGGGLQRWTTRERNAGSRCFEHYRHDASDSSSLAHDFVRALYEDRAGSLWIGTNGGGLSRWDRFRPRFHYYRHDPEDPASLGHDAVRALFEDRAGNLWIGTEGAGLDRLDRESGRFIHYRPDPGDPQSLAHGRVNGIFEDAAGALWISTLAGLDRLDPESGRFTHYRHDPDDPQSLAHDTIYALAGDREGHLWIGTLGGGLDRFDPRSETFVHHRHDPRDPSSLSDDFIRVVYEDRDGSIWVGTARGGLDRRLEDGTFEHFRHAPDDPKSLSHNHVVALFQDRAGRLWIGTGGGGLNRFEEANGSFERFTEDQGLPNNFVHSILEDDLGRLWLATNRGLSSFDPATGEWASYDARDGLQDEEFLLGAAHRGRDGTLYFGGVKGFNAFRPETFRSNDQPPPVVLTGLYVFEQRVRRGSPMPFREEIVLEPEENFFAFEFAALNFIRSDKNRYLYRLEGFEEDWVAAGSRHRASYTKVPPGRYVFRVRGANNDGAWSVEDAAVRVVVLPPPWRTPWAYALYTLAGIAALFSYQRHQKREVERQRVALERQRVVNQRLREADQVKDELIAELEEKNSELERFTYTVSHDLKSPLVTILGFLGFVRRAVLSGDRAQAQEDLDRIETAARRMRRLLDELLELSRVGRVDQPPEEMPFAELVAEARAQLAGQLEERGTVLEIAEDLPVVRGDRVRLVEILQNLVDNAVKFTPAGQTPRVEIGLRRDASDNAAAIDGNANGKPSFYVRDWGRGLAPGQEERIFGLFERLDKSIEGTGVGLALVKRIVELHGGRIWVDSPGRGQGCTFYFTLPMIETPEQTSVGTTAETSSTSSAEQAPHPAG